MMIHVKISNQFSIVILVHDVLYIVHIKRTFENENYTYEWIKIKVNFRYRFTSFDIPWLLPEVI